MSAPTAPLPAESASSAREVHFSSGVSTDQLRYFVPIVEPGKFDKVLVDLTACVDFDLVPMLWLLTVVNNRNREWSVTSFRLPDDPSALRTLQQIRFPKALSNVAGVPYRMLLSHPEDQVEVEPLKEDWTTGEAGEQILRHLRAEGMFGLSAHRVSTASKALAAIDGELVRWSGPLPLAIFNRYLHGQGRNIPRIVVWTLLSQLWERRDATVSVLASEMRLSARDDSSPPELLLASWDDGLSPVEQLRAEISDGRHHVSVLPGVGGTCIEEPDGKRREIPAEMMLTGKSSDADLFLASVLCQQSDNRSSQLTLSTFYANVLQEFGGSVEIHADDQGLVLEGDQRGLAGYRARMLDRRLNPWRRGNLIMVRIPIRDDS